MIKIFEKLQSPEIFKVAEVCTNWFNISQHKAIINTAILNITQSEAVDFFLETTRKFKFSLKFKHSLPEKFHQFSSKFTENIIEVCFIKIRLSNYYDFIGNLTNLKNMRSLKIINCSFEGDRCSTSPEELSLNLTTLLLTITSTTSMKDYQVQHLLSIIPNLKSLSCNLSEDFYLEKAIVGYVKNPKLTKSLKEIYFISFKSSALCDIFHTNHLNLTKFFWKTFNAIDNVSQLETFLVQQKELRVLDLYLVQDFLRSAVRICTKLNLDQLSFNLNLQTIQDSETLQVFWKLKYLKIYNCNSLIFKSLTKTSELESLTLIGYTDDMSECIDKFKYLTSLTSLRVEESFINDNLIQSIFKNLSNLKELYLLDHKLESVSLEDDKTLKTGKDKKVKLRH